MPAGAHGTGPRPAAREGRPAPRAGRAASSGPRTRLRAAALAAASWLALLATWALMVGTYTGQRVEHLALVGSLTGAHHVSDQARRLLSVVSMPAAVALVLGILVAGLWSGRRHPATRWRALWAAGAVVATNLSCQVLKHWVLTRPDFGLSWRYDGANTLPSGHTAMAASAAVAAVLVAPAAWRAWAAWCGAVLTAAMGYSTLVCQWHRPADVIAAVLLAVGWGAAAVACGAWSRDGRALATPERARRVLAGLGLASGAVALAGGVVVVAATQGWSGLGRAGQQTVTWWASLTAYGAGSAGTVAVAFLAVALLAGLTPPARAA